jgi:putative transcriptional regulator
MNEEHTIRVRKLGNGELVQVMPDGSTKPLEKRESDWARVDAMTEEEIEANALSDPDNPPLTEEDFRKMDRIPNVRLIRDKLGLTQLEFAETFGISLELVRSWEQGPGYPDSAARAYLRVIEQAPEMVKTSLTKSYQKAS